MYFSYVEEVSYLYECKTVDSPEVVAGSWEAIVKGITEEAANTETGDLRGIKYRGRRQGAPTEAEEEALAAPHHPQPFLIEPRPTQSIPLPAGSNRFPRWSKEATCTETNFTSQNCLPLPHSWWRVSPGPRHYHLEFSSTASATSSRSSSALQACSSLLPPSCSQVEGKFCECIFRFVYFSLKQTQKLLFGDSWWDGLTSQQSPLPFLSSAATLCKTFPSCTGKVLPQAPCKQAMFWKQREVISQDPNQFYLISCWEQLSSIPINRLSSTNHGQAHLDTCPPSTNPAGTESSKLHRKQPGYSLCFPVRPSPLLSQWLWSCDSHVSESEVV